MIIVVKIPQFAEARKRERQKQALKAKPRKSKRYKTIVVTDKCSLSCQMTRMGLGKYTSPWNLRRNKTNPDMDSLYKGNRKMFNVKFPTR